MTELIYGEDERVFKWVAQKIPYVAMTSTIGLDHTIGLEDNGKLIAGCIYTNYSGDDIEMTFAASNNKCGTKRNLFAVFDYPFNQLGCKRITAFSPVWNQKSRNFLQKIGFVQEGKKRGTDFLMYGFLSGDCDFIKSRKDRKRPRRKEAR